MLWCSSLRLATVMPAILDNKNPSATSVFRPSALLREARRQKGLATVDVPSICILDPDGDIVRQLRRTGAARPFEGWPCYHTTLDTFVLAEQTVGIVGCAVGAPFAVLVAEQLFASGCRLLVSVTSAGQITPIGPTPYFVLIDRALRDEGTSHHYLPPSTYAHADPALIALAQAALGHIRTKVYVGPTWTTDAPFRETEPTIAARLAEGILAVEMESAALYAFAAARRRPVICVAHVSNQLGQVEGDFEKGEANGARGSAELIRAIAEGFVAGRL
jgi:uridine phosphorylase